jgi:hypothetical protein
MGKEDKTAKKLQAIQIQSKKLKRKSCRRLIGQKRNRKNETINIP